MLGGMQMSTITTNQYGAVTFTQHKEFWTYVNKKGVQREDIMKLSNEKKLEFFLKWKHGMSNPAANEELEETKIGLYYRDRDIAMDKIPLPWQDWVKSERDFESYCYQIKQELGLMG